MAATATQIIEGALLKIAYQPDDDVSPEDLNDALAALNDYLNSINARGGVFPNVNLGLSDTVPIADEKIRDLKFAFAGEIQSMFGKRLEGKELSDVTQADTRFRNSFIVVYPATPDAGLRNMPSSRRW